MTYTTCVACAHEWWQHVVFADDSVGECGVVGCECPKYVEPPQVKDTKPKRRPITVFESDSFAVLGHCTFLPATADKRFVRQMRFATEITERQADYLLRLLHRYRRQLGSCKRPFCPECRS